MDGSVLRVGDTGATEHGGQMVDRSNPDDALAHDVDIADVSDHYLRP
jgi:hypothetical protein